MKEQALTKQIVETIKGIEKIDGRTYKIKLYKYTESTPLIITFEFFPNFYNTYITIGEKEEDKFDIECESLDKLKQIYNLLSNQELILKN